MWQTLGGPARSVLTDSPEAVALRRDMARSRQHLAEIRDLMELMASQRAGETDAYRDILASYQTLSLAIQRAARALKRDEDRQADEAVHTEEAAAHRDFTGIAPIKGTLGPGGRTRGTEVSNLQRFLAAAGSAVPASNEYDKPTRLAVQEFQRRYHLEPTGIVGAETRRVMNELIRAGQAPAGR